MEGENDGAPGGEIAAWLLAEVARLTGVAATRIDPRRPVSGYGLDSLAAVELAHAVEQRYGAAVPMTELLAEVSIAELASRAALSAASAGAVPAAMAAAVGGEEPAGPAGASAPAAAAAPPLEPAGAGEFPLSHAQRSLWFLHALEPESPAYNVPAAVRVAGPLDPAALAAACERLVERHPALRTTFARVGSEPVQRVAARGAIAAVTHDAAAWSEERLAAHLAAAGRVAFDLESGPLVRLTLYRLGDDDHVLLLAMHHIVTDFWSLGVLLDELGTLLGALAAGRPPRLPAPPPSHAEFALAQERALAGAAGEALWSYWRGHLAGELPVLDLPADRPRPRVQTTAGGAHRQALAAPLAAAVHRQALAAGATPFVVLLAAFATLLYRYTGQAELLLGTVSAARTRAAFARTVGYFVNPLVLRADLNGGPDFAAVVGRARGDALGAFAHQDLPFPLLVERLQPRRDPGRSPLFQAMFVLQRAQLPDGQDLTGFALGEPGARVRLGGLTLSAVPVEQGIAQFDLTLTMGEAGGRLIAVFDYNRDLFDAATIARLAGHFERLLGAALAAPGRAVAELPLLGEAEERQLLHGENDTRVIYRDDAVLAELFLAQAAATPDAPAVVFAGVEMSYRELARRAGQLGAFLRLQGVGPEVLVGVCVDRSFDVLTAALGVLAAGGAYLPIDPEYPPERIRHLIGASGIRLLLTHERLRAPAGAGPSAAGAGTGERGGVRMLCLDTGWDAIAASAAGEPAAAAASRRPDAHNLACVIFTSGSTGLPKGVMLPHRGLVNMIASFRRSYQPGPGDRILPLTSIAYASFAGEVLPLLASGGAVVLPQKHELLDAAAVAGLVARHQVTMVSTVPSLVAGLVALGDRLPRLRLLLLGGEALAAADAAALLAARPGLTLVNGYGLTETSICSTIHTVTAADLAAGQAPPIGRPVMNQRLHVLDANLRPRPLGCAGELYVAGDGLARGYLGRPEQTAERFLPDPFACGERMYRTGDLAARRAGGNLTYLGRADQQVKLRGFRIELAEVEAALALHPGIAAAAAAVRRDGGDGGADGAGRADGADGVGGTGAGRGSGAAGGAGAARAEARLVGYFVPRQETAPPPAGELLAWLRGRLPDYMVPAALVAVAALPRTPNGKLDAARLPPPERGRPALGAAFAAPRSELERTIAGLWREALNLPSVESVGLDDNFFDLGGHSLLMARVHAGLRQALGRDVPLIELFQYPTVGTLARHLAGAGRAAAEVAADLSGLGQETADEAGANDANGAGSTAGGRRPARDRRPSRTRSNERAASGTRLGESGESGDRGGDGAVGDASGHGDREACDIAVIGLAGRFPGAPDVRRLWENLAAGREGITFFTAEELLAAGADPALVARPDYVKAKGILGDVELFDAAFFGLNPREVELMDPQHRVFLECAWEAMEDAGWDADRFAGLVGVYGGESMNTYLLMNLLPHMELVASADTLQASLGNDKDPLTARVSYKLNLRGPSITIQSASSTSLVAVHSACQALLNRDCDMALAGGVSIHLPERTGYLYQEGGTVSRDGHCRAFDAASTGFVSGHGCGVVVLKRLSEALADRDHVYAVIKGTACNNDGSHKVSFMAPSVDGQVHLYEQAYANAGVDPATVSYVECHGTGTAMGDPIEIAALTQAFAAHMPRRGRCAIGSLKSNIGHLDTAAGVCGLIKAVLALHHRTLPPSLHFQNPNPRIDFAHSPFFVNTRLRPWDVEGGGPRRAGVTSLGMGGTNAHVVLEEAPAATVRSAAATGAGAAEEPAGAAAAARPWQLLILSAKSAGALDAATQRLAGHLHALSAADTGDVADIAYTLQVGRRAFQHRRALLCRAGEPLAQAAAALAGGDPERVLSLAPAAGDHPVAFLFPGQGAQHLDMARGLDAAEPVFRAALDRCCALLPFDLRAAMYGAAPEVVGSANGAPTGGPHTEEGAPAAGRAPGPGRANPAGGRADGASAAAARLQQTAIAQPALFAVSWALAQLWMSWGVRPAALLGHSIGEYVAACLAGVFSLEDALALVTERGRLLQGMAPGAMLAVPLPEAEAAEIVAGHPGLSLAAVNRPDLCVISGNPEAIEAAAAGLARRDVTARRLHTSHAFHSATADPMLAQFTDLVRRVRLAPPRLPVISNLSGSWLRAEEATDPVYWARQVRGTVRFADGVALLLAEPQRILLEVGPGDTLATAAREHPARRPAQAVISSLRHPKSAEEDAAVLLRAVARLWLAGGEIDWQAFSAAEERRRVPLPTYPFERRRYWVDPPSKARPAGGAEAGAGSAPAGFAAGMAGAAGTADRLAPRDWTHVPVWRQAPLPRERRPAQAGLDAELGSDFLSAAAGPAELWLLLADREEADAVSGAAACATFLAHRLAATGRRVVRGFAGPRFARLDAASYTLAPGAAGDYDQLLAALGQAPTHIVHLWNLWNRPAPEAGVEAALDRAFYSLVHLAQALGRLKPPPPPAPPLPAAPVSLVVVTAGLDDVTGEEELRPLTTTALGPCAAIPREMAHVRCRILDLLPPADAGAAERAVADILAEAARQTAEPRVALRRGRRFVLSFEPLPLAPPVAPAEPEPPALPILRRGGVCLITGGLGGLGLELAEHLARRSAARLVLAGRSEFPEREGWDARIAAAGEDDAVSRRIRRLQAIEALGAEVLVIQADLGEPAAAAALVAAAERRFGAVHAVVHAAGVPGGGLLQGMTRAAAARVLAPKVQGALGLAAALAGRPLDFFALMSSLTAVLPQPGQADYAAANAFLDAFAATLARRGVPAVAIDWDAWRETGMAAGTAVPAELRAWRDRNLAQGIASHDGVEAFERAVASGLPQVLVAAVPLAVHRRQNEELGDLQALERLAAEAAASGNLPGRPAGPAGAAGAGGRAEARGAHPRPALANPFVSPVSEVERRIAAVWQEVLGIEPVGLHDNFFELGGNSLAGLRVVQRLKERLQSGLTEVSLYEAPTVAALARLCGDEGEAEALAAATITDSTDRGARRKAALLDRRRGGAR